MAVITINFLLIGAGRYFIILVIIIEQVSFVKTFTV